MSYRLQFSAKAFRHLQWWEHSGQTKTMKKLETLLGELKEHPFTGTGKPEPLKGNLHNCWSRRITGGDRLVYSVHGDVVVVEVVSMKGHYEDK